MKQLGPVIEKLLRSHNLWKGYQQYQLVESWKSLVGPTLAEVTRADKIENGTFHVFVKDSVWSYHLSMLKPELIKKLNNHAGQKIIKDIYLKIGSPGNS